MILEVSRRIQCLESRIKQAKDVTFASGRSNNAVNSLKRSQLEMSLVARIQNPSQYIYCYDYSFILILNISKNILALS